MRSIGSGVSLVVLTWAATLWGAPALAQTSAARVDPDSQTSAVDDVVVTARRRDEAPISVPVSVTVLGAEQIQNLAIDSLQDLRSVTPGISVGEVTGGVGGSIGLRGVSTPAGSNPSFEQTVAINVDGVPLTRGGAVRTGQIDMERIEVLRGPQALFFGKNSPAGVISITTADPTRDLQVKLRGAYEFNAEEQQLELAVSGPISDVLGGRLVLYRSQIEGWRDNIADTAAAAANAIRPGSVTGSVDGGPQQEFFFTRGTLKFEPNDSFTARLKFSYAEMDGIGYNQSGSFQRVYCPNGAPQTALQASGLSGGAANPALAAALAVDNCKPDDVYANGNINPAFLANAPSEFNDLRGASDYTQQLHSLEMVYRPTQALTLTSVTGVVRNEDFRFDTYAVAPSDAAVANVFGGNTQFDQFTEELRLSSDFAGPIDFMIGAFYEDSTLETYNRLVQNGSPLFVHNVEGETRSVFGQLIWDITSTLELAGGARWSRETKDYTVTRNGVSQPLDPASAEFENTSPEVTLTWRPTDRLTFFGAYKEGFKSGGFATTTNAGAAYAVARNDLYQPEAAEGFEGGIKALLFDGALRVNLAAYDYDYSNLQVNSLDNSTGIPVIRVNNAAEAKVRGLEGDFTWRPQFLRGFTVRGAGNYNDAKYEDFLATCWIGQTISEGCNLLLNPTTNRFTGQQLGGERLLNSPEWTGALGVGYDGDTAAQGIGWGFNLDANYKSSYNPHPELHPGAQQESATFLNAGVRVFSEDRRWEVSVVGRNLTDKYRVDVASNVPQTGTATSTGTNTLGGRADLSGNVNRGREVMLQVTFRPF